MQKSCGCDKTYFRLERDREIPLEKGAGMLTDRTIKVKFWFLLCITLVVGYSHELLGFTGKSYYRLRSQGCDAARDLVGWQPLINKKSEGVYGAFAITPAYLRTFDADYISKQIFGASTLTFSGSRVANRKSTDILADYFGLPTDFQSLVCFDPQIKNMIVDLQGYVGLDNLLHGLYMRLDIPIVHSSWDLGFSEHIIAPGINFDPAGYMSTASIARADLQAGVNLTGDATFGEMVYPLQYGKSFGRELTNAIAELRFVLGWNATGNDYHAGANLRVNAPTGNRPKGEFLFESIVGNGKHWELGAGLTTHYSFWHDADNRNVLGIYFDANFTHLFATSQVRSFDLRNNGAGSRYMLIEDMGDKSTNLFLGAGGPAAPYQYTSALFILINKTSLPVKVSVAMQADMALKLSYNRCGMEVDLGYGFYGRSKETFHHRAKFLSNRFALKGDAQIYGFQSSDDAPIALDASQSQATIHAGQKPSNADYSNANVDSPTPAASGAGLLNQLTSSDATSLGVTLATANTSNPPILLTDADLSCCSAALPRAITNKLFFNVGNIWDCDTCMKPFFGIGGEVEWAAGSACSNSACSQWSLWAKGGIGF